MAMNNARAPFDNLNLRKAVNYAIDRPAQIRLLGAYAGRRTVADPRAGDPGLQAVQRLPAQGRGHREGEGRSAARRSRRLRR